jgi:hypothetical protein
MRGRYDEEAADEGQGDTKPNYDNKMIAGVVGGIMKVREHHRVKVVPSLIARVCPILTPT